MLRCSEKSIPPNPILLASFHSVPFARHWETARCTFLTLTPESVFPLLGSVLTLYIFVQADVEFVTVIIGDETDSRLEKPSKKCLCLLPLLLGANYMGRDIGSGWQSFGLTVWRLLVVRVRQTIR